MKMALAPHILRPVFNRGIPSCLYVDEKPDVGYSDIGGMDIQKQEVREAVELPLTHFELCDRVGSTERLSSLCRTGDRSCSSSQTSLVK